MDQWEFVLSGRVQATNHTSSELGTTVTAIAEGKDYFTHQQSKPGGSQDPFDAFCSHYASVPERICYGHVAVITKKADVDNGN